MEIPMHRVIAFTALALAGGLLACPPPPIVEPPHVIVETDAGDYPFPPDYLLEEFPEDTAAAAMSPCGRACESLRGVGCPEGFPTKQGVSCYRGCLSMARHQRVPTSCWTLSKTAEDVRRCGGIQCLPTPSPAPRTSSPN
jgi:hypothetical protein